MKKYIYIILLFAVASFVSCDLDEMPEAQATLEPVFGSITGLEVYTSSFYNILPDAESAHQQDHMADYSTRKELHNFLRPGAYGPQQSDGWEWEQLRDLNFFIQNCTNPKVAEKDRLHYIAIAKFFRAYFYFDKVKRFGDVPWTEKAMTIDDPDLYNARDPRADIMAHILEDINFAIDNLKPKLESNDGTRSTVTKSVALGLKSRICLFEGTYRKYHNVPDAGKYTSKFWLEEAAAASKEVMDAGIFKIHTAGLEKHNYRDLFISLKPVGTEVMLASVCDKSLSIFNNANWWWTSATYGQRVSLSRYFVNTYLNLDGTPFTNDPGYKTMVFTQETQNRDLRLAQTIRTPGYKRTNGDNEEAAPPVFSYSFTGYHPIKFSMDDVVYDSDNKNENSIPLMRYAEILLNYAEAKAELNDLSDTDWKNTIGVLRERAGITTGTTTKPTAVDPYFQSTYFPEISDATLLEIRRERAIELVFEGFRFYDLVRWRKGNLMEMEWNGMYVPALDVLMDLDSNGQPDVCFVQRTVPKEEQVKGVTYVNVSPNIGTVVNPQVLKEGTKGEITWLNNIPRKWENKHYLYPVPELDIIENPNLKPQNPGW